MSEPHPDWWLYLLDCDGRLYTGISTDPVRRYREHLSGGPRGARFTRAAKKVTLMWSAAIGSHSDALRAEHRLRKLPRQRKLAIIATAPDGPAIRQLFNL
jgi:putative endonuclease